MEGQRLGTILQVSFVFCRVGKLNLFVCGQQKSRAKQSESEPFWPDSLSVRKRPRHVVKGIVHAAGTLADGLIKDQTRENLQLVCSAKARGEKEDPEGEGGRRGGLPNGGRG